MTALLILAIHAPTTWERLPPILNKDGVAGAFAGSSGGRLFVAGGANFPRKKPWEGGTKVWHDAIYGLEKSDGTWRPAGFLPRPLGYGVSVTHRDAILCVGGSDKDRHYAECFRLRWSEGRLKFESLPPLPRPVANACGSLVGDTLIVAGGLEKPDSSETLKSIFALDLVAVNPAWKVLDSWPGGPRMLATAASFDGAFWLIGGVDLESGPDGKLRRKYLRDAYRYDPGKGWNRVADLPYPVAAAPSPCPTVEDGVFILSGDDGSNVTFTPLEKHPGFMKSILRYDRATAKWMNAGTWESPRVTTPVVKWGDRWVIPSGEVRPGVRSPDVWAFAPGDGK